MKIDFQDFGKFTEILQKGAVFRFQEYKFDPDAPGKARWFIILNNKPPSHENDIIVFVTLRSNWRKPLDLCDCEIDVNVISDENILNTSDNKSAYDLSKIDGREAISLYTLYKRNELSYKGLIKSSELKRINDHIENFFSESPSAEVIPESYKKIIFPSE